MQGKCCQVSNDSQGFKISEGHSHSARKTTIHYQNWNYSVTLVPEDLLVGNTKPKLITKFQLEPAPPAIKMSHEKGWIGAGITRISRSENCIIQYSYVLK